MNDHQYSVVVTDKIACGGFLFLNSTANTRAVWGELLKVHKMQMGFSKKEAGYAQVLAASASKTANWGNEQNTFSVLARRSKNLSIAWLPDEEFRSGLQLKNGNFSLGNLRMIHANWMIGVTKKVENLKKQKLWFLSNSRCTL